MAKDEIEYCMWNGKETLREWKDVVWHYYGIEAIVFVDDVNEQ